MLVECDILPVEMLLLVLTVPLLPLLTLMLWLRTRDPRGDIDEGGVLSCWYTECRLLGAYGSSWPTAAMLLSPEWKR